jgi:starch-binding outer membrane protein, SusD/RagB family
VNDPAEGIVKYEDNGWTQINDTHSFNKKYTTIMAWKNKAAKTIYPTYTNPMYGSAEATFIRESQDLVLIRFSDILLMHAELTETATGLNRVRARVGLPAIAYSFDALKKERRHELVFEGLRYFDLLRWYRNDAGTILKANQDGCPVLNSNVAATMNFTSIADRIKASGGFWPIPKTEISLSNGILKQSTGWDQADANL